VKQVHLPELARWSCTYVAILPRQEEHQGKSLETIRKGREQPTWRAFTARAQHYRYGYLTLRFLPPNGVPVKMKPMRIPVLLIAAVSAFAADAKLTPEMQAVVNHISSDSLRGHLSFLASDLLEGRATPSLGWISPRNTLQLSSGAHTWNLRATISIFRPRWSRCASRIRAGSR
jgi:hypothetical protein